MFQQTIRKSLQFWLKHYNLLLVVPAGTQLATAVAVPTTAVRRAIEMEGRPPITENSNLGPEIFWTEHIGRDRPLLTCSLMHNNKTIMVQGLLDTGADVTIISYLFWPKDWKLVTPLDTLTGIGGATLCLQSESVITVRGPEGKTAIIRPFIVKKPITVWGRDLLSQWGVKLEVDF